MDGVRCSTSYIRVMRWLVFTWPIIDSPHDAFSVQLELLPDRSSHFKLGLSRRQHVSFGAVNASDNHVCSFVSPLRK